MIGRTNRYVQRVCCKDSSTRYDVLRMTRVSYVDDSAKLDVSGQRYYGANYVVIILIKFKLSVSKGGGVKRGT